MEGGLLRDVITHKLVTEDHWTEVMLRPFATRDQIDFDKFGNSTATVEPAYDPHCANNDISHGCEPVEVISVDRLVDQTKGPDETAKIAKALLSDSKTGDHVIAQEAWGCIWEEMIVHKRGPKTIYDRPDKSECMLS